VEVVEQLVHLEELLVLVVQEEEVLEQLHRLVRVLLEPQILAVVLVVEQTQVLVLLVVQA
jgi:hypothetical protein